MKSIRVVTVSGAVSFQPAKVSLNAPFATSAGTLVVGTYLAPGAYLSAISRKDREYLRQGRVVTIDGELYQEPPNGDLRPYHRPQQAETHCRGCHEEYEECEYEEYDEANDDDILYIKGRPYTMDTYGNYVPVRMPGAPRRKSKKKHYR